MRNLNSIEMDAVSGGKVTINGMDIRQIINGNDNGLLVNSGSGAVGIGVGSDATNGQIGQNGVGVVMRNGVIVK